MFELNMFQNAVLKILISAPENGTTVQYEEKRALYPA